MELSVLNDVLLGVLFSMLLFAVVSKALILKSEPEPQPPSPDDDDKWWDE